MPRHPEQRLRRKQKYLPHARACVKQEEKKPDFMILPAAAGRMPPELSLLE
ncbi:hypothetical protein [Candidatus Electronema sp. JM]|uniref:hypothetical protein n=1 Tax=Candidatus Electronema sp. JM TaxID=3401571 RepID=UPI003AA80199